MNKYSKRALKTTATVGMSLAMVLSGVATPVVKVAAAACTVTDKKVAQDIIDSIKADLKAAGYTLDSIPVNATHNKDAEITDANKIAWFNIADFSSAVAAGDTIVTVLGKAALDVSSSNLDEVLACLTDNDDAKKLVGFTATTSLVDKYVTTMTTLKSAIDSGDLKDGVITSTEWKDDFKELYADVIETESYKNNLTSTVNGVDDSTMKDTKNENKDNIAAFKEMVEDYTNTYISKFVKDYVKVLEDEVKIKEKSVKALVNDSTTTFSRDDLKALEDTIKDIKEDKITKLTDTGVTYAQVGDEDEVTEYIDGLEAIVDEIKEVNDLLKTNTPAQKALKAIKSKVAAIVNATELVVGEDSGEVTVDEKETAITRAMNEFRTEDLENLTTYVEDFFNEFYTVTIRQRSNGNYSVDFDGTDYARYLTSSDADAFDTDEGVGFLVTTLVENDAEETYYDALVGNVNDAEKLMKAVAAVEDIRLGSTFTTAEASKIVAAKKAHAELTATGNPYGLTAKELRTVKSNGDLIGALYTKLILSGTITESGWIDKGNGNWDYINADGSKSTKWVAAGKDWYFVQNGTMLRSAWVAQDSTGAKWYYVDNTGKMVSNTTIDGFVIDANGVWTK